MFWPIPCATVLAGATVVALALSCGASDNDAARQRTGETTHPPAESTAMATLSGLPGPGEGRTPPPAVGRPADFKIPEARRQEILAAASEFERPLLEDGDLTFSEYEQAVFAGLACLEEKGGTIRHVVPRVAGGTMHSNFAEAQPGPRLTARGQYRYLPGLPGTLDEVRNAIEECAARYHGVIDFLWAEATAPTESELQTMANLTGDCMRDRGLSVPEHPSQADLRKAAYPPDGVPGPQHVQANGAPIASVLALLDCQIVTRFDMGFE